MKHAADGGAMWWCLREVEMEPYVSVIECGRDDDCMLLMCRYVNTSWTLSRRANTAGSGNVLMVKRASIDMLCLQVCLSLRTIAAFGYHHHRLRYWCIVTKQLKTGPCNYLLLLLDLVTLQSVVMMCWWCEGFVLKKDQKKESEEEQISLEELIEREVRHFVLIT